MDNTNNFESIANATAYSPSGDKLGRVGQLYLDDTSGEPSFVSVKTGLFGMSESLVPLTGYSWNGEDLVLAFEKDVVQDAPNIDADRHLSEQEQDELFTYYGGLQGSGPQSRGLAGDRTLDTDRSETTAGGGVPTAVGDLTDSDRDRTGTRGLSNDGAEATRSEEQLNVGKESVETGRARLRKYTTTEEQSVTVPVTKEKVVVERTPVEGSRTSGTIDTDGGEVVEEITTREERPVVDKEVVEKEHVRLGKETVTENQTVTDQVRKEHIDVDTDASVGNLRH